MRQHSQSEHFLKYIRSYNSVLSFASLGIDLDNPKDPISILRIHGKNLIITRDLKKIKFKSSFNIPNTN